MFIYRFFVNFQVLSKVFSFLTPPERRIVKLVCNRWYDACNIVPFIREEKMVIDAFQRVSETIIISRAVRILEKSKLKYFNLEFRNIGQKMVPQGLECSVSFWEKCGNKVLFLHFVSCVLDEVAIKKLTTHCNNLRHLSWKDCSGDLFESLISKNGFVDTLSSLNLNTRRLIRVSQLNANIFLLQLLQKFSSLRNLQLKLFPECLGSDTSVISVNEELLMALVQSRLENLSIKGGMMSFDAEMSVLTRVPINRTLRHLRLKMWKSDKNVQLCFVLKFKGLQKLEFSEMDDTILQNICENQVRIRTNFVML